MSVSRPSVPRRGPAHDTAAPEEQIVAGERWPVRCKRALLARAIGALDACIASLQRLKTRAGGPQKADDTRPADRRRSAGQREAAPASPQAEPPQPRRRLRRLLIHLALMLAGGLGGMVLAYDLFSRLLEHQTTQIGRQREEISRQAKSLADSRKKSAEERAKRIEAENRLALIAQDLAEPPRPRREPAPAGRAPAGAARTGNCALGAGNIGAALKGCIDQFNRP